MVRRSTLHSEYLDLAPSLLRLQRAMAEQFEHLLASSGLTLGVPIESRLKAWDSIAEKLERKRLKPKSLSEIDDLLGLRIIFLFQRDLESFHSAIGDTFRILSSEDTSQRLADAQFGYKSRHYLVSLPEEWDRIPSFKGLTGHKIEVQSRTLSQHIWAAASHKLQYKHEEGVPLPLRRSIYRVSALLETVDLELARVLNERDEYVRTQAARAAEGDKLDVTVAEAVLDEVLPVNSKDAAGEDYSDLLVDLQHFKINTRGALRSLLLEKFSAVMKADAEEVRQRVEDWGGYDDPEEPGERLHDRLGRGVFFTHVGLVRQALSERFGEDEVRSWQLARISDA